MKIDSDSAPLVYGTIAIIATFVIVLAIGGYSVHKKQKYLEEHGCQETYRAETGKRIYCGKACTRAEEIVILECKEGRKVEFQ